ncbi:MAG TPA: prepilin-type N-terminal cleavage/methylation domain-containing protein [Candidatus Aminicenantes bacterium]|nr:prepilin-type N-terminal cleavage/methylation domain-containing protein [Candidatus Aminicenantes bacterium]
MNQRKRERGFSLIEVLVGLFLVGVAVLGLAQLFLIAVTNNLRADRIANATFLAQQQIDWLRGFTMDELIAYAGTGLDARDEVLDLNLDGTNDFRRVTEFRAAGDTFQALVHVYSAEKISVPTAAELLADPAHHRPKALITTIITR